MNFGVVCLIFATLAQLGPRSDGPLLGGIAPGANVAVAIRTLGMPADVASLDTGHTWIWRTPHAELRAITDDEAVVRAVDERPLDDTETALVNVDGKSVRIPLKSYTVARADADLNTLAEFSTRGSRLYSLGRNRELVLLFDDGGVLTRAVTGDRGFVSRLGLVTVDREMVKTLRYVAPKLRNPPSPAPGASQQAVVRYQILKDGQVGNVRIVVSSRDPAADERALRIARVGAWTPAKLNNVAVTSVAFRLIDE